MFPVENVIPLIPQKPPFVMVGKLLHSDGNVTRSSFVISPENIFVKNNIFQEAGLLENIAQTAALGAGYQAQAGNEPVSVGYIGAVKDFQVFGLPEVGEEIITEVAIENQIFDVTVLTGKIWLDGILLAQCEMKVFTKSE